MKPTSTSTATDQVLHRLKVLAKRFDPTSLFLSFRQESLCRGINEVQGEEIAVAAVCRPNFRVSCEKGQRESLQARTASRRFSSFSATENELPTRPDTMYILRHFVDEQADNEAGVKRMPNGRAEIECSETGDDG